MASLPLPGNAATLNRQHRSPTHHLPPSSCLPTSPFLGRVYASLCHRGETTPPPGTVNFTLPPPKRSPPGGPHTRCGSRRGRSPRPAELPRSGARGGEWGEHTEFVGCRSPGSISLARSPPHAGSRQDLGGAPAGWRLLPCELAGDTRRAPRHGGYRGAGRAARRSPVPPAAAADSQVSHRRRRGFFCCLVPPPPPPGDLHRDYSRNTGSKLSSLHPPGDINIWGGPGAGEGGGGGGGGKGEEEEAGGTTAPGASGDVRGEGEGRWARCVPARSPTIKDGAGTAVPGTGSGEERSGAGLGGVGERGGGPSCKLYLPSAREERRAGCRSSPPR